VSEYVITISLEAENDKELTTIINVLHCTLEDELGLLDCEIQSEEV
jgi:hypothetical protein